MSGPKGTSIPDPTAQVIVPQNDTTSVLAWQPPASVVAGPATVIYAESDVADFVGEGEQRTWTQATASVYAGDNDTRSTGMSGDADDDIQVALPYLTATGSYADLDRSAASVTANSGGCNESRTNLVVDRLVRDAAGTLVALTARLEQWCDAGYGPLHLFLRYDRDDPTTPAPLASAGALTWRATGRSRPRVGVGLVHRVSGRGVPRPGADRAGHPGAGPVDAVRRRRRQRSVAAAGPDRRWRGLEHLRGHAAVRRPVDGRQLPDHRERQPEPGQGLRRPVPRLAGCNAMTGTMAVDSVTFDDAGLARLEARMVVSCDSAAPIRAALRYVR